MTDWDKVNLPYLEALKEFRNAERALAAARAKLSETERARKVVFDRLVEGARVRSEPSPANCGTGGER